MVIHHGARRGKATTASHIVEIYVSLDEDADYPFGLVGPIVTTKQVLRQHGQEQRLRG